MLLDVETLKKSSELDPEIVEFMKNNPSPPLDWQDADNVKAGFDALTSFTLAQLGPPEPAITEEYRDIPMRDGYQSEIKIIRPSNHSTAKGPLLVFIFGGGWVAGSHDSGTAIARSFVRLFKATVVSISYRLAPEHKWPIGWNDTWDSVKWLADNASVIGADLEKGFIVGGVSAGATMSAFVAAESQKNPFDHPITGQWLTVPSLMNKENVPEKYKAYFYSLDHNRDAPILQADSVDAVRGLVGWEDSSPGRWPVLYSADVLARFPPTYIQASGADPFRDDALIFHEMLREAGVRAAVDLYPGCPHAHYIVMPGLDVCNKAVSDLMVNVGWLLGQSVTTEEGLKAIKPGP